MERVFVKCCDFGENSFVDFQWNYCQGKEDDERKYSSTVFKKNLPPTTDNKDGAVPENQRQAPIA